MKPDVAVLGFQHPLRKKLSSTLLRTLFTAVPEDPGMKGGWVFMSSLWAPFGEAEGPAQRPSWQAGSLLFHCQPRQNFLLLQSG